MQPGAAQSFWQKLVKGDAGQSKHTRPLQQLSKGGERFLGGGLWARCHWVFAEGQMVVETGCDMV